MKNDKTKSVYGPALNVLLCGALVLSAAVWGFIGIIMQWEF